MATAIRDLNYYDLPDEIKGLEDYDRLLVLVRLNQYPVGQIVLPVTRGCVEFDELQDQILKHVGQSFWTRWLWDYLNLGEIEEELPNQLSASIAICTRDRPNDLDSCLAAIMRLPNEYQEVIVIDSASKADSTRKVVQKYPRAGYFREDYPGLNRARNRALREAKGDIVAFIDDDTIPDRDWLRALLSNFTRPPVLCVTGLTMPIELETRAQEWFERYCPFNRGFTRRAYHRYNLDKLSAGRAGVGANMALRRNIIEEVGKFNEALDAGTPTCSGGDTEMFARILEKGFQIIYDPAALNWHRHRQTWEELRQVVYGYGVGAYAVWTHQLFRNGQARVLKYAFMWFTFSQMRAFFKSLLRLPNYVPLDLLIAELRGCLIGPYAYYKSSQNVKKRKETIAESI